MIRAADVFAALLELYGPQEWWPASDPFEIMAGALLVQRTSWSNARMAIERLRDQHLLQPGHLRHASTKLVESCVRCAGFYRSKAVRLIALAAFFDSAGGYDTLNTQPTAKLRLRLLEQKGVGEETADAILLYAFERPVVVIDEYLRRLMRRLTGSRTVKDSALRNWVCSDLATDVAGLNEIHALVVAHGKSLCASKPRCGDCPLRLRCRDGSGDSDA